MKCKFCNELIPDGMNVCPKCGAAIHEEKIVNQEQIDQEQINRHHGSLGQDGNRQPHDSAQQNSGYGYQYGTSGTTIPQNEPKPINGTLYMVLSVLSLLLCCLPLGIVSVIYSSRISSQQKSGDYEGACRSAREARTFLILSVVLGLVAGIVFFGLSVMGFNASFNIGDKYPGAVSEAEYVNRQGKDGLEEPPEDLKDKKTERYSPQPDLVKPGILMQYR